MPVAVAPLPRVPVGLVGVGLLLVVVLVLVLLLVEVLVPLLLLLLLVCVRILLCRPELREARSPLRAGTFARAAQAEQEGHHAQQQLCERPLQRQLDEVAGQSWAALGGYALSFGVILLGLGVLLHGEFAPRKSLL